MGGGHLVRSQLSVMRGPALMAVTSHRPPVKAAPSDAPSCFQILFLDHYYIGTKTAVLVRVDQDVYDRGLPFNGLDPSSITLMT